MLRGIKRRKRAVASVSILTAAVVALSIMAFAHPGFSTTDVDLNDGGIWVTRQESGQLGHLNYQAGELDSGLAVPSNDFDVVQYEGDVFVIDRVSMSLNPVDTAQASFRADIALPGNVAVTIRGGTLTFLDPLDGRLWAAPADQVATLNFDEQDPLAVLGPGSAATADESGAVHAVSVADGKSYSWSRDELGFTLSDEQDRPELKDATELSITAVGETPVALDSASGSLFLPGTVLSIPEDAELQLPGTASETVVLATGTSLIRQPLSGGDAEVQEYASGGIAVAPVQVGDCLHAAWPGDARVIRDCADDSADLDEVIELRTGHDVRFREHRGIVALNDMATGVTWLMSDELVMVDNWADLIPPTSDDQSEEHDESMDDTLDIVAPDPTEENNPPVANDDLIFGARTGRSTLVPVLHNDTDPDGDILTVELVGDAPGGVRISPVQNATQFQVEIPEDYASNAVNFRYRVHDGRGGRDEANVALAVRSDSQNAAPEELREQGFEVEQRSQYEHAALEGWFDPDGDDFFLVDAYSDSGDTVRFNPNGRIVYTATGEPGPTTMTIVVSDGEQETTSSINVEVRERGTASPVANADYLQITQGENASIRPLANDFLPASENARVASVTEQGDVSVDLERATDTVYITSDVLGTHYVNYTIAAGPNQAQGHIRVDVVEPNEEATPVAVRDVALLPMGGEALIDLTENDVDPTGGVLVVQSVENTGVPVSLQLVHRHLLRVEDLGGLTERVTLHYSVSNGRESARGEIVVIPVEPPEKPRNPVASDDTATLREGDYLTVDVTENDFSPDNVPFSVSPELVEHSLLEEEGFVFIDGDTVRAHVVVGGPSYIDVVYEIADRQGNTDTANLRIEVEPRDPETNDPPRAREVTSRVLAGNTVRIPIPMNGIDPDGDGVELVGWDTAPEQGRITQTGPDFFDFEAFATDSGTTTFDYRVRDRWGAESTNSVTVGIAQPGAVNQPPSAAIDPVHVRPDRSVAVSVLDNDTDPDGDELILMAVDTENAPDGFDDVAVGEDTATVNFTAPSEPGEYTLEYSIEDVRGAGAIGAIQVTVDPEAPLIAPRAVDDIVDLADVALGEPFVVPVLENDRDIDGNPAELEIDVLTGAGTIADGGVQVVPAEEFQVITYRVTDQDGGTGEAFIFVPSASQRLPFVASDTVLRVRSGVQLEISLSDVVVMPEGGTPRITITDTVSATNANSDDLVIDDHTLQYTSEESYVGDAAINFEVTDGSGPNDEGALTARLSVPIIVLPSSEVPPEFHGVELQVQPAEAATTYDLKNATWDPDDGDLDAMVYSLRGGDATGVDVQIDDQEFRATALADTPVGTRGVYEIELEDPAGNVQSGTVIVEVVASTRPHPRAAADSGTTDQGVEISINVTRNDFNPFQNLGEPLNVRDVRVLRGDVQGAPTTDGTNVTVTPGQDFSGVLTLQYTVEDATGSDTRTATGNVEISVRGRPDAPLRPNVGSVGDSQATLSWAAPAANGAPITGYIVQWDGGAQECPATSCTVTGLTNDTVYNFQVVAVNEVGESDPSAASIDVRPDVRPERPNPPVAERGNQELFVTWEAPENRGSPIEYYILQISPAAPDGAVQRTVETTNFTWSGLRNGIAYDFTVQAFNRADEPSEVSQRSRPVVPAGPPGEPPNVTATSNPGPSRTQTTVTWGAAFENGAAIERYTVEVYRGGQQIAVQSVGGATHSRTFEGLETSSQPYFFRVIATNVAGDSTPGRSNEVRSVGKPGTPSVELVRDNDDGTSTIRFSPGNANGYSQNEVRHEYNIGSGWTELESSGQNTIRTAPTAEGYELRVRTVAETGGIQYVSDESGTIRIRPYTAPGKPTVTANGTANGVDFSWSGANANGREITGYETSYRVNGGSWSSAQSRNTASLSVPGDPGQRIELRARALNAAGAGEWSDPTSGTVRGPKPTLRLEMGQYTESNIAPGQFGQLLVLDYQNLVPGTYNYSCWSPDSRTGDVFRTGQFTISGTTGQVGATANDQLCILGQGDAVKIILTGGPSVDLHGTLETPERSWRP